MSLRDDPHTVCVRDVLLEMRQFRMDLVQTSQQLRFTYWAIMEGSRPILRSRGLQVCTALHSTSKLTVLQSTARLTALHSTGRLTLCPIITCRRDQCLQ